MRALEPLGRARADRGRAPLHVDARRAHPGGQDGDQRGARHLPVRTPPRGPRSSRSSTPAEAAPWPAPLRLDRRPRRPLRHGRRSTSRPTRSRTAAASCTPRRRSAERARRWSRDGAAIVDVGGESTRPGSDPVSRRRRSCAACCRSSRPSAPRSRRRISVDTSKAEVARRALAAGAAIVNDVTALRGDPAMAEVVAEAGCPRLPHAHAGRAQDHAGRPALRATSSTRCCAFLEERLAFAVDHGVRRGAGAARSRASASARRSSTTCCCSGTSTASSRWAGRSCWARRASASSARSSTPSPDERVIGTVATTVLGVLAGAAVFRVHDVRPNCRGPAGGAGHPGGRRGRDPGRPAGTRPSTRGRPADDATVENGSAARRVRTGGEAERRARRRIEGIALRGRCGVTAEERAVGQTLVVDVRLTPRGARRRDRRPRRRRRLRRVVELVRRRRRGRRVQPARAPRHGRSPTASGTRSRWPASRSRVAQAAPPVAVPVDAARVEADAPGLTARRAGATRDGHRASGRRTTAARRRRRRHRGAARAFVSLGSNLGDRARHLRARARRARGLPGTAVLAASRVYETAPQDLADQPLPQPGRLPRDQARRRWNCCAPARRSSRPPAASASVRFGPRTLDVDILLFEGVETDDPELTLPHPRMWQRAFVLVPLADLWGCAREMPAVDVAAWRRSSRASRP